jgi:hypothetical protein
VNCTHCGAPLSTAFCGACGAQRPAVAEPVAVGTSTPETRTDHVAVAQPPWPQAPETPASYGTAAACDATASTPAPEGTSPHPRNTRRLVSILAAAVLLLGVGGFFGGRWALAATAVSRMCALQPADVTAAVGWTVDTGTAEHFADDKVDFVRCHYDQAYTGSTSRAFVEVNQNSKESGLVRLPGAVGCTTGGFWGGRGHVCLTDMDIRNFPSDPAVWVFDAEGTRFAGDSSFSVSVRCVEPTPGVEPSQRTKQACINALTTLMPLLASRLNVAADPSVTQDPITG